MIALEGKKKKSDIFAPGRSVFLTEADAASRRCFLLGAERSSAWAAGTNGEFPFFCAFVNTDSSVGRASDGELGHEIFF